jgi:CRISPR system Cascade subunit CasB
MTETKEHPFVTYLQEKAEDRAILAALRRGLGQPPGAAPAMFPYVVPFLGSEATRWQEEAYYLIASLFGLHPQLTAQGNMGTHFAELQRQFPNRPTIERRFITLMAAHPDDLAFQLRQAVSLLKSHEKPINWHQLMYDVLSWNNPDSRTRVHRQWAAEFWRQSATSAGQETAQAEDDSIEAH